jgi:hypothetical protein
VCESGKTKKSESIRASGGTLSATTQQPPGETLWMVASYRKAEKKSSVRNRNKRGGRQLNGTDRRPSYSSSCAQAEELFASDALPAK